MNMLHSKTVRAATVLTNDDRAEEVGRLEGPNGTFISFYVHVFARSAYHRFTTDHNHTDALHSCK